MNGHNSHTHTHTAVANQDKLSVRRRFMKTYSAVQWNKRTNYNGKQQQQLEEQERMVKILVSL